MRAVLEGPYTHTQHDLVELQCYPFARWAPPRPADYLLPRALLDCLLHDPRGKVMTSHCGRCGLCLPDLFRSSLDPDPPADLTIFPTCPDEGCGGPTGWYGYAPADPGGAPLPA